MNQIRFSIFDTESKKLVELGKKRTLKIYTCGPTVYAPAHVGNLRAYIVADILNRSLREYGYGVNHVINITDVGHLTDDADSGEDKVEDAAKELKCSAKELTRKYTKQFIQDLGKLSINKNRYRFPFATDYIKDQIKLIEKIEKKGAAYKISDGVYFDTSKFSNYGALDNKNIESIREGARVTKNSEKRNPTDFALWKLTKDGVSRQQEWDSPWGRGFPGWHIECSALIHSILGKTIDIHTGGIDHIPIHHNNEIAQSYLVNEKPLSKAWLHIEFLTVNGRKMSKSLGNTYTLDDLYKKGYFPHAFRYLMLTTHYRSPVNLTPHSLQSAQTAYLKLQQYINKYNSIFSLVTPLDKKIKKTILSALYENDLDTPKVIASIWNMIRDNKMAPIKKVKVLLWINDVLGLGLEKDIMVKIPKEIKDLIQKRDAARENKNFDESDQLRNKITSLGWNIEDTDEGSIVTLKHKDF